MLDSDTKRRIDSCRDMLVGRIPDPKSQVELITISLIYKFMDDMDAEAEELGGLRSFFTGDYAKYGWAKLMAPTVGGQDMLNLFSEAIATMPRNPGIPPLFRDIFKNAYLPFRDPATLKSFLKEIDHFTYDHSEKLGDAFEYLLSVLGSQGDAGQFRTPRHIIDFIVQVVDPKIDEKILDPACGTAGFLISSYKHILAAATSQVAEVAAHGQLQDVLDAHMHLPLTSDQRAKLAQNLIGYDISPDMVRLSLVNLYLHGFLQPHIEEYDTLTSDEKWNEYADVILANPPFMSPKGGIKPHKRFGVQSNRSEVLFVDYIAEHLTKTGRAGVIVPEGIIFQSGSAYKTLRKKLVGNYLVAVASLPAGVFQPYSGVKTSVLILDKRLAKASDSVLFVKVASDGFGLGAQRRAVAGNDLPEAARVLAGWMVSLREGTAFESGGAANVSVVAKGKIAESGDYNLSGDRYRADICRQSAYELLPFEEVCTLEYGESLPAKNRNPGEYPVLGSNGVTGFHNTYLIEGPVIIVGRKGSAGEVTFVEQDCFPIDTTYYVKLVSPETTAVRYIYNVLKTLDLPSLRGGAGIPGLNRKDVYNKYKIPLPPLAVQQEIVAEIEGYQKIIDGARQVVENYKPRIDVRPEWPIVELGEVSELITKGTTPAAHDFRDSGIRFIKIESIDKDGTISGKKTSFISEESHQQLKRSQLSVNDVLFSIAGTKMGITAIVEGHMVPANTNQALAIIRTKDCVNPRFLIQFLRSLTVQSEIEKLKVGVAQFNLSLKQVAELEIPLPSLETQQAIVSEIEEEQRLVAAAKELVARFEAKIKATIGRVWGEEAA